MGKYFQTSFLFNLDRLFEHKKDRLTMVSSFSCVYEPIENGLIKNIDEDGKRKARFHQWLKEFGKSQLTMQIGRVMGVMEISSSMRKFKEHIARQKGLFVQLNLFDDGD